MSARAFRSTVRGVFLELSADQRAELLACAPEHDIPRAAFIPEGHLSYDLRPSFAFRFLDSGEAEEDILVAIVRAGAAAEAWLAARGFRYENLKSHADDLSKARLSQRRRRPAARQGA